jgi:monoamine oxidase
MECRYYDGTASDGEHGEALVTGGFYQIFHYLANETPLDVRFDRAVVAVTSLSVDSDPLFSVECSDGSVMYAEHVICTAPLGVLRTGKLQFTPHPPQLDRMCQLQFGLMNLVWLWFPYKFWPEGYNFFGVARSEDTPATFSTFLVPPMRDQHGEEQAIMMCQVFDEFALAIEDMTDLQIANSATAVLRRVFTEAVVPEPIGCRHSNWRSDEYARGSYCCAPPVGSLSASITKDWCTDSGVKGIHFAGEGCHLNHLGTAHGAYISGIREATIILEGLGLNRPWAESVYLEHE